MSKELTTLLSPDSLSPNDYNPNQMTDDEFAELGQRINEYHTLAAKHAGQAVEAARQAGELLVQAKRNAGHGNWLQWLADNVHFSERTAQAYMRVAKQLPKLTNENRSSVADLTLSS